MNLLTRRQFNIFSDKASLILRALLRDPKKQWTIPELQKEGLSYGQVINIIEALAQQKFIFRNRSWRGHFVRLEKPGALMKEWVRNYNFNWNPQAFYSTERPEFLRQLCDHLQEKNFPHALTMISGSQLVAPYVVQPTAHIYVGAHRKDIDKILREIERRFAFPHPRKVGNVCIAFPYYKSSVYRDSRVIDGFPVVSNLQLYLDLINYPVTGADQARWLVDHLADEKIPLVGVK